MEAVAVSVAAAPIALTAATLDEKAEEGATLVAAAALDGKTEETAASKGTARKKLQKFLKKKERKTEDRRFLKLSRFYVEPTPQK